MCALVSSASSRSVTTGLRTRSDRPWHDARARHLLTGQPDDCPSERVNLSRRSLASRLAGSRFDGRVPWQRVVRCLAGWPVHAVSSKLARREERDEYKFEKMS